MPQERTAILRMVPRKTLDEALLRHNAGQSRPDHGRRGEGTSAIVLADDRHGARTRLGELIEARKGIPGPKPDHAVDFIFAGPPAYADEDAWTDDKVRAWTDDSIAWFKRTFPDCTIAVAAAHRDESSPHIHLTMVPERDGHLGWKRAQIGAVGDVPERYSKIQDLYHETVAHHGLSRGIKAKESGRKHRPLTREAGIAAARREVEAGRRMKREAEEEKREAAVQQERAERLRKHLADVADIADEMGRHNNAHAIRRASVDPETRLLTIARQIEESQGRKARAMFRRERQEASKRHDAFMAALRKKETELMDAFDRKAAELKRQLAGWEEIGRKKPWPYGQPLASAGG